MEPDTGSVPRRGSERVLPGCGRSLRVDRTARWSIARRTASSRSPSGTPRNALAASARPAGGVDRPDRRDERREIGREGDRIGDQLRRCWLAGKPAVDRPDPRVALTRPAFCDRLRHRDGQQRREAGNQVRSRSRVAAVRPCRGSRTTSSSPRRKSALSVPPDGTGSTEGGPGRKLHREQPPDQHRVCWRLVGVHRRHRLRFSPCRRGRVTRRRTRSSAPRSAAFSRSAPRPPT